MEVGCDKLVDGVEFDTAAGSGDISSGSESWYGSHPSRSWLSLLASGTCN